MPTRDTTILVAVLGGIFGFICAVFLVLILRFTFRTRHMHKNYRVTSPELQTRLARIPTAQERRDRWSSKGRGQMAGTGAVSRGAEAEEAGQDDEIMDDDKSAREFGATVHEDGTRSYLKGWFALDRPPTMPVDATFRTHPGRGAHAPVSTRDNTAGDEWEVKSQVSDSSDPEAYHPQREPQYHTV